MKRFQAFLTETGALPAILVAIGVLMLAIAGCSMFKSAEEQTVTSDSEAGEKRAEALRDKAKAAGDEALAAEAEEMRKVFVEQRKAMNKNALATAGDTGISLANTILGILGLSGVTSGGIGAFAVKAAKRALAEMKTMPSRAAAAVDEAESRLDTIEAALAGRGILVPAGDGWMTAAPTAAIVGLAPIAAPTG